jgi:hypothetical protein
MDNPASIQGEPVSPRRTRIAFSIGMTSLLIAIVVVGQLARSNFLAEGIHRLWFGNRSEISVVTASYGLNCRDFPVPPPFPKSTTPGNVTAPLKQACDGTPQCDYVIDAAKIGDPANSCGKDFRIEYLCTGSAAATVQPRTEFVPAEANGKSVTLTCQGKNSASAAGANKDRAGITVKAASYGLNCRDFPVPANFSKSTTPGNATVPLKQACDGRDQCDYVIDHFKIGDPAHGCPKDFSVEYLCPGSPVTKVETLAAEAEGKTAELTCAASDH